MSRFDDAAIDICMSVDFPASLFYLDEPDCPILLLNHALETLLGKRNKDLQGTPWSALWQDSLGEEKVFGVLDSLRLRNFARSTGWGQHADGNRFYTLKFFETITVPNQSNIGLGCHFDLSSVRVLGQRPSAMPEPSEQTLSAWGARDRFFDKVDTQKNAYQMRAAGLAMAIRNGVMLTRMADTNLARARRN